MQIFNHQKSRRLSTGIMAFMILFVVLFSAFFLSIEANHHCSGNDCPICACMQMCENTLHHIVKCDSAAATIFLPFIIFFSSISDYVCSIIRTTPVSEKVRLDN
jgi:hypothetical protein